MLDLDSGLGWATERDLVGRRRYLGGIHPDLVEESAGLSLEWMIRGDTRGVERDRFCQLFERCVLDLDSGLGLGDREGFCWQVGRNTS
jgi:hypothetical protein